jgi:hypothetical protein
MLVLVVVTAVLGPVLTERAVVRLRRRSSGDDQLSASNAPVVPT